MIDWWSWRWRGLFLVVAVVVGIIAGWAISNVASPRAAVITSTVTTTQTVTQSNVLYINAVWHPDRCEMTVNLVPSSFVDTLLKHDNITLSSTGGFYAVADLFSLDGRSVIILPVVLRFMSPNITLPFICKDGVPVAVRYGTYVNGPYFEQIAPLFNYETVDWSAAACTGNCTLPLSEPISVKHVSFTLVYASPALANMTMRSSPDLFLYIAKLRAFFSITIRVANATS
ncbi:MAG: hypothetical protein ACP5I3_08915 [Thermoproteus sp.]